MQKILTTFTFKYFIHSFKIFKRKFLKQIKFMSSHQSKAQIHLHFAIHLVQQVSQKV